MKLSSIVRVAVLALPLVLVSCGSHKKVVQGPVTLSPEQTEGAHFISSVQDNAQTTKFITSKVKFSVEVGPQKLTLTGNLKMKRDDVIRLQLMAFGFVEAGRIELTKDYVLIMDRINKQYLKTPYMSVDFLRNSGLNFNTLQALFWNELFKPNEGRAQKQHSANSSGTVYSTLESGDDMIISLTEGKMDYSWLASKKNALIKMANILYKDRFNGNTQLNWDYDQFEMVNKKMFPKKSGIVLTTPDKEVKLNMTLNYVGSDTEWETRTEISNKYREVTVDEILRRFMAL
ncbi:protein of unknown function [Prevotella aff. ruminicola Tc2-24]|jgi:hypothetical protein|uniref:Lipoprotein n=1 Tax=Prevotella aff. ruminicola Tc2-24 TaxID=81582 RepID=A0A1I0Q8H4_9BACT|nr:MULTISPECIES: DUF4292 domain-containing protein [Prevotella]MBR5988282.1 DUF4292 domain-containing protein [Prevotella sp.]SEE23036.1 protein of unknown function [Prevotella sp. lc2012]SEW23113.1 protein of unknown function [Prevotella aff. ruminicola Tc2-24]